MRDWRILQSEGGELQPTPPDPGSPGSGGLALLLTTFAAAHPAGDDPVCGDGEVGTLVHNVTVHTDVPRIPLCENSMSPVADVTGMPYESHSGSWWFWVFVRGRDIRFSFVGARLVTKSCHTGIFSAL